MIVLCDSNDELFLKEKVTSDNGETATIKRWTREHHPKTIGGDYIAKIVNSGAQTEMKAAFDYVCKASSLGSLIETANFQGWVAKASCRPSQERRPDFLYGKNKAGATNYKQEAKEASALK